MEDANNLRIRFLEMLKDYVGVREFIDKTKQIWKIATDHQAVDIVQSILAIDDVCAVLENELKSFHEDDGIHEMKTMFLEEVKYRVIPRKIEIYLNKQAIDGCLMSRLAMQFEPNYKLVKATVICGQLFEYAQLIIIDNGPEVDTFNLTLESLKKLHLPRDTMQEYEVGLYKNMLQDSNTEKKKIKAEKKSKQIPKKDYHLDHIPRKAFFWTRCILACDTYIEIYKKCKVWSERGMEINDDMKSSSLESFRDNYDIGCDTWKWLSIDVDFLNHLFNVLLSPRNEDDNPNVADIRATLEEIDIWRREQEKVNSIYNMLMEQVKTTINDEDESRKSNEEALQAISKTLCESLEARSNFDQKRPLKDSRCFVHREFLKTEKTWFRKRIAGNMFCIRITSQRHNNSLTVGGISEQECAFTSRELCERDIMAHLNPFHLTRNVNLYPYIKSLTPTKQERLRHEEPNNSLHVVGSFLQLYQKYIGQINEQKKPENKFGGDIKWEENDAGKSGKKARISSSMQTNYDRFMVREFSRCLELQQSSVRPCNLLHRGTPSLGHA